MVNAEQAAENADFAGPRSPPGQLSLAQLLYAATNVSFALQKHLASNAAQFLASDGLSLTLMRRHFFPHSGALSASVKGIGISGEPEPEELELEPEPEPPEPPEASARGRGPGTVDWSMLPFLYAPGNFTVANVWAALPVVLPPMVS